MKLCTLLLCFASAALAQISPPSGGVTTPPPTYSASFSPSANGTAVAATTTDFWCIAATGAKAVFITNITLTGQASAAAIDARVNLVIRSTLDTGGTPTTITAVPHDSNNAAATATVTSFAANPATLGTVVATLKGYVGVRQSSATNQPGGPWYGITEQWGTIRGAQPLTLRPTTQAACLNGNGGTPYLDVMVNVEWYEQ